MTRPLKVLLAMTVAVAMLGLVSPAARAQERASKKPAAEPVADSMQASMDAVMPMMGQMMTVMMTAMLDVAARPETAEKMATFSKNYFDALMSKGFTRDESLRLVMSARLPSMPGQN